MGRWTMFGGALLLLTSGCAQQHTSSPAKTGGPAAVARPPAPATPSSEAEWPPNDPNYWVKKLAEPSERAGAVLRVAGFFEDALSGTNGDVSDPEIRAFIEPLVGPLTIVYVEHAAELDTKARTSLIKLLASFRDPRTEPALRKAFEDFAQHPSSSKDDTDLKWAARASGVLKLESLAQPLLAAFVQLRVSTPLGNQTYRDLGDAMLAMPSKSWVEPLIALLAVELSLPKDGPDPARFDDYRNQLFWQVTAADLLGRLGDARAVEPLLRVMLDPAKPDVQPTALPALVKLGRPTVEAATQLLQGTHARLTAFSSARIKALTGKDPVGAPQVEVAALVLGVGGRADAVPALLAVLATEKDARVRAQLARQLTDLPASDASKAAFQRAYASLKLDAESATGGSALEELTEAVGNFHDSSLVDWLLQRAARMQGNADDLAAYRAGVVLTALKLARPGQLPTVKKAVDKYGGVIEKQAYEQVAALLASCGERSDCYLAVIQRPENQEQSGQFVAIKAGYMLGILGGDPERDQLIDELDALSNAAVRFVAARTIDHLTPSGNKAVAAKLAAIIAKNAASPDREKAMLDGALKQVLYRIAARE